MPCRVLIADDEDSMRSLVARAIAMDGHDTVTAEDGAEALDILTREQGAFDLLLTDIQMPVMDGIALALAAARDFPDLKILLMTGFADQRERASGLNAIVHDVVTKPFSVADIRTAVADALAAKERVARSTVVVPAKAGTQYAAASRFELLTSLEYWVTRLRG
jgi:two-component system cell cycle response regulator CpdR